MLPCLVTSYLLPVYEQGLGDAGLEALSSLSSTLLQLHLKGCTCITDTGVQSLAKVTSLEDIDLRLCEKVTAQGVAPLQELPRLRRVLLHGTAVVVCAAPLLHVAKDFCDKLDDKAEHFSAWWRPDDRPQLNPWSVHKHELWCSHSSGVGDSLTYACGYASSEYDSEGGDVDDMLGEPEEFNHED